MCVCIILFLGSCWWPRPLHWTRLHCGVHRPAVLDLNTHNHISLSSALLSYSHFILQILTVKCSFVFIMSMRSHNIETQRPIWLLHDDLYFCVDAACLWVFCLLMFELLPSKKQVNNNNDNKSVLITGAKRCTTWVKTSCSVHGINPSVSAEPVYQLNGAAIGSVARLLLL